MANEQKAATLAAWTKAATHYPMLPSGTRVGIRIPDLPGLIAAGGIPGHLLDVALGTAAAAAGEGEAAPTKELIIQQKEFTDNLVLATVVEPKLKPEDVDSLPYEDKLYLVEFATRQRDLDALGEHMGGLPTAKKWDAFREGDDGDAALAG